MFYNLLMLTDHQQQAFAVSFDHLHLIHQITERKPIASTPYYQGISEHGASLSRVTVCPTGFNALRATSQEDFNIRSHLGQNNQVPTLIDLLVEEDFNCTEVYNRHASVIAIKNKSFWWFCFIFSHTDL